MTAWDHQGVKLGLTYYR